MDQISKQNKDYTDDTLITDIFDLNTLDKFINADDFLRETKAFGLKDQVKVHIKISDIQAHLKYQTLMANYNVRVD